MVASATPADYRRAIETVASAEEVDALLVIYTAIDPSQSAPVIEGIRAGIAAARAAGCQKPVLACLMTDPTRPVPLEVNGERVPTYVFPENAVRALAKVVRYAEWRSAAPGQLKRFDDTLVGEAKRLCQ